MMELMELMELMDESDLELLSLLSDSDSEEDEETETECVSRTIKIDFTQCLNDAEFLFRFRLPKSVIDALLKEIMPYVRAASPRNHEVPPLHQLLLTLRFYALGSMLKSVINFLGISTSLAYRIVQDITTAITKLYRHYVIVHLQHVYKFYKIAKFPRVFGVIDCTHVCIPQFGDELNNLYGHIQVVCDANLKFMNIEPQWSTTINDATIFNKSHIKAKCAAGVFGTYWLLGDSAYQNQSYLQTPLSHAQTESEQRYNAAHVKTWETIEHTIKAWKRRFPIVSETMRLSRASATAIIMSTAILHNISRNNNLDDIPPEINIPINTDQDDYQIISEKTETYKREELIINYFNDSNGID